MRFKILFLILISIPVLVQSQINDIMNAKLKQNVTSMEFRDTDVKDLLRLMARQNALNIVLGPEIKGRVSVSLKNVSVEDLLHSVLNSLGFHFLVDNNIILIKSFERAVPDEISTKVFKLEYQDAYDIITPITTLLTSKGKVEVLQLVKTDKVEERRSDVLVVSDILENINKISSVINEIDIPERQLLIEVRLIETILGENQKLGFDWPKSFGAKLSGASPQSESSSEESAVSVSENLSAYTEFPITSESFNFGILSFDELQIALDILEEDTDSKLISNPKISTKNKNKAKIRVGTTFPIAEVQRSAAGDLITYKDKDIDVELVVTPRIQPDNKIFLEVHPTIEEIIGYSGPGDYPQPIISVREVVTNITVESEQTIVIGGMVKESKQNVTSKVWLLGDIPILGYLFKSIKEETKKTDLLIFITPKII